MNFDFNSQQLADDAILVLSDPEMMENMWLNACTK
jgi:hypothetical protein